MLRSLYFLYGFFLVFQVEKIFGNFSLFDLMIVLIFCFERKNIGRIFGSNRLFPLFRAIALLLLTSFTITFLFNPLAENNLSYSLQYLFCIFIALPVFILSFRKKNLKNVCSGIILGAVLAAIVIQFYSLNQLPTLLENILSISVTGGIFYRIGMIGVNDYAIIIVSCMVYLLHADGQKLIKFVTLALLLYLLIRTGSRVGIVMGMMLIFIYLPTWISVLSTSLVAFALVNVNILAENNILLRLFKLGLSDGQRLQMLDTALITLNENILGVGFGEYIDSRSGYPVHNFYLLNLVEQGVVSGTIFIMVIFAIGTYTVYYTKNISLKLFIILHLIGLTVITHGFDRFFWIILSLGLYSGFDIKSNPITKTIKGAG